MLSSKKKSSSFKCRYLFIISISLLAFLFVAFDALDIYRYYLFAESINPNLPIGDIISDFYNQGFDFIYYLLFYLCNLKGLPYQLVTGVSVGLLFAQILLFIDLIQNKYKYEFSQWKNLLLRIVAVLSVSFITVLGIGRNVTALMFFFFGVNYFLKRRRISVLFFALAIFTHITLFIYLAIFLFAYYWNGFLTKKIYVRRLILVSATIVGLFSYKWIKLFFDSISSLPFFNKFEYYSMYLTLGENPISIFNFSLGRWDVLMFITAATILFYALFFIRRYNPIICVSFFGFIFLSISMGYSVMFTQRTLLFLMPFQGAVASAFFSQQNKPIVTQVYKILLAIVVLAFIINVYSYRDAWIFKFPEF